MVNAAAAVVAITAMGFYAFTGNGWFIFVAIAGISALAA